MSSDGILRNADGELVAGFVDGDTVTPLAIPLPPPKPHIAKSKADGNNAEKTQQGDHCAQELTGRCCRAAEQHDVKRVDNIFTRDLIIGLSDGLTVPFALTAGLSSLGSSHLVVIGGLAELFSGAISMGVGGYLSTKAERDNYRFLLRQTRKRVETSCTPALQQEIFNILGPYGLSKEDTHRIVMSLEAADREFEGAAVHHDRGLTSFLLRFGEGVETISAWRLYASALTIGISYFVGGLIPMIPYFCIANATKALFVSIGITAFILILFGLIKGYMAGSQRGWTYICYSALQTLAVGTLAAGAAYGIVRALDNSESALATSCA